MSQASSSVPFRHRYRLTRLGVHFVFVAAFTMIGGALRGFNLLLVLAGLLVGALLVQWRCSRWVMQSTSVTRFVPTEAFANVPFRVRYHVSNLSRYLPVWMIRIDDPIDASPSEETITPGCGVGVVGPNQIATAFYDCLVTKRGRYQLGPMSVSTLFPFSLFNVCKLFDKEDEFHVFPTLLNLRRGWQNTLVTKQGGAAAAARRSGPNEGVFFGLREWQTGDNPRWIHHRTTARVGEPIVRQFEQQRQFDACLLVDCFDSASRQSKPSAAVETAISFAATIVTSMDGSPGNRLVVAVADANPGAVARGRVHGGKRRMLELLSEATPTSAQTLALAMEQAAKAVGYTKDLIVISTRDMQDALSDDSEGQLLAARLQAWVRRGSFRWINVRSPDFQTWLVDRSGSVSRATSARGQQVDPSAREQRNAQIA